MKVLLIVVFIFCALCALSLPVEFQSAMRRFGASSRQQTASTCGAQLANRSILINNFNAGGGLTTDIPPDIDQYTNLRFRLWSNTAKKTGLLRIESEFQSHSPLELRRMRLYVGPGSCADFRRDEIAKIAKTRHFKKGTDIMSMRFNLGDNVSAPDTPRACCNLCAYVQPIIHDARNGERVHILNEKIEQSTNERKTFCRKGRKDDFLCDLPDICINVIRGTEGDDVLIGTPYDDHILGLGGNDKIISGDGADYVNGGDGHDFIRGGPGRDEILGSDGNDNLKGGGEYDKLFGGDGDDYIGDSSMEEDTRTNPTDFQFWHNLAYGGNGDDTIVSGDGRDLMKGDAGNDTIIGGRGDDIMRGNEGNDLLMGGDGDDSMEGSEGADLMYGGDGDDSIEGREGADRIYGGDGDDYLAGYRGPKYSGFYDTDPDKVYGENGDDYLIGDDQDLLDGGEGDDKYYTHDRKELIPQ
ncbi:hypothetical protein NDN08_004239 [Rhodosorus marinus]|uniref:Calcium-binding protein n=1 Tax=Rhodosorus marinus TaxID=101924 RepID=A0AAV8UPS0_9RHOD|nr:hypothetical protein NDN08_004239 [Rhodosorus marinus]